MESNFHATVLAHPPGMPPPSDEEERRRRDLLASGGGSGSPAGQPAGAPGATTAAPPSSSRSTFSLRSPKQPDFHLPSAFASPPPANTNTQARSILHSPFAATASAGPPLPPVVPPPPSASTPSTAMTPRSPSRQAPMSVYYPHEVRDASREQSAAGSFYDPTTDTTTTTQERRVSDAGSWQNASTPKVG